MDRSEKVGKREQSRSKFGRLTEAEYNELNRKHPAAGVKRNPNLRRLTEEEYAEMSRKKLPKLRGRAR